jgi:hypothetical protein
MHLIKDFIDSLPTLLVINTTYGTATSEQLTIGLGSTTLLAPALLPSFLPLTAALMAVGY